MFLILPKSETRCSYKIVLIKKKACSGPKPFRQAGISTRLALLLPCRVQRDRHCVAAALPSRCRYSRQARFPLLRSLVLSRKDNFGRLRDRAVFVVFNHFFVFFSFRFCFQRKYAILIQFWVRLLAGPKLLFIYF